LVYDLRVEVKYFLVLAPRHGLRGQHLETAALALDGQKPHFFAGQVLVQVGDKARFEQVHLHQAQAALHVRLQRNLPIAHHFDPVLLDMGVQNFLGKSEILLGFGPIFKVQNSFLSFELLGIYLVQDLAHLVIFDQGLMAVAGQVKVVALAVLLRLILDYLTVYFQIILVGLLDRAGLRYVGFVLGRHLGLGLKIHQFLRLQNRALQLRRLAERAPFHQIFLVLLLRPPEFLGAAHGGAGVSLHGGSLCNAGFFLTQRWRFIHKFIIFI
jgi:hypothetical protein